MTNFMLLGLSLISAVGAVVCFAIWLERRKYNDDNRWWENFDWNDGLPEPDPTHGVLLPEEERVGAV